MTTKSSNQNFIVVSIIILLLLLATVAYQWWKIHQLSSALETQQSENTELQSTHGKLEKDFQLATQNLEQYRSDNQEMNTLIDQQKEELAKQKEKISGLIWKTKDLKAARIEIETLNNQALGYMSQLKQLQEENQNLTTQNTDLRKTNEELEQNISSIEIEKKNIKDSLSTIAEDLTNENEKLSKITDQASLLKAENISCKGYKIKENGNLTRRRQAENIHVLKICFDLVPNELSTLEEEAFVFRIITPNGETMYDKSMGSGMFTKSIDGSSAKYTKKSVFDIPEETKSACIEYKPSSSLISGTYSVEIYNKDFLCGSTTFKLR